jgi:hypothetical protein
LQRRADWNSILPLPENLGDQRDCAERRSAIRAGVFPGRLCSVLHQEKANAQEH